MILVETMYTFAGIASWFFFSSFGRMKVEEEHVYVHSRCTLLVARKAASCCSSMDTRRWGFVKHVWRLLLLLLKVLVMLLRHDDDDDDDDVAVLMDLLVIVGGECSHRLAVGG